MTTTNSSWYTTTKEEYYEAPYKSVNAPQCVPFSVTIADGAMDADGDVVNLVKIPQTAKLLYIYIELADVDTTTNDSDIDLLLKEVSGGTTTTTTLYGPGTWGQNTTAGTDNRFILPAVGSSFLHEGIPTDSGIAEIRLEQNAAITTDEASSVKGFVVYI